jgi:hypothetical protein
MTTKVIIAVSGNKKVQIVKSRPGKSGSALSEAETPVVSPGSFIELHISGDETIGIIETGEFVN